MKVVIDTNVVVSALRSPRGASAELLRRVLAGGVKAACTTALLLEYEAVATRPEHLTAAQIQAEEAIAVIDALALVMEETLIRWRLRPTSLDGDDDFVLEAAVNARADALITANLRHLSPGCSDFGILCLTPKMLLSELQGDTR